jgi:inner membrane protein
MGAVGLWSALSLLPDLDVIGFGLGVRYGDEWGHRGATHSFVFSIALGLAIGFAVRLAPWAAVGPNRAAGPGLDRHPAPRQPLPAVRTAVIASAVLASHALLDTLTDGGLGCALFWPFNLTRYFAPWNPIPVAPIGWSFLSVYGLGVALTELVFFAPVFWFALSPARTTRSRRYTAWLLAGTWLAVMWWREPLGDAIVSIVLREDTEYAAGYAEQLFQTIKPGAAADDVRGLLGPPLSDVQSPVGAASDACWVYSRSPSHHAFRARGLCFSNGKVVELHSFWYFD